ncbi:MAG: cysteine peptidase family C39 domain-containing protein [Planctomycetota bacterium]
MNPLFLPALALAFALFWAGRRAMRRCESARSRALLAGGSFVLGIPGFLMPLYYLHAFDGAAWFYEFRSIPFSELTAALSGLFAGALSGLLGGQASEGFLAAVLAIGIAVPHLKPMISPLDASRLEDRWKDGVCLQSSPSTCGAASAVTILRTLGIEATEREIARECFTSLSGTENWFLARAFRRRGLCVSFRAGVGVPSDLRLPAIAGVRAGGAGHFIALLPGPGGRIVAADPLSGRSEHSRAVLARAFDFTGFFMEVGPREGLQEKRGGIRDGWREKSMDSP